MTRQTPRAITQRELRNDSGTIMRAVEHGESFTITRNGTPVGRVIPNRLFSQGAGHRGCRARRKAR
ncbi:MAG: type II toxin-antitoxin system Phd/YefM family antitoxin [Pseudonocardiaceae bacterium]